MNQDPARSARSHALAASAIVREWGAVSSDRKEPRDGHDSLDGREPVEPRPDRGLLPSAGGTTPPRSTQSWRIFFEGYELGRSPPVDGRDGGGPAPPQEAGQGGHPADRRLSRDRPLPGRPRPAQAQPRAATRTSCSTSPRSASSEADLDRDFYNKLTDPPHAHPPRADRHPPRRPTAGRSASSTCTSATPRSATGSRSGWSRSGTGPQFDLKKKRRIIYKLNAAELFETFLHTHYVGQKRFSLEGGEMLIPLLDAVIERSAQFGRPRDRPGDAPPRPAQRAGQHPATSRTA